MHLFKNQLVASTTDSLATLSSGLRLEDTSSMAEFSWAILSAKSCTGIFTRNGCTLGSVGHRVPAHCRLPAAAVSHAECEHGGFCR